jgi:cytoskeletal protein CcmA (bactofilin family)
MKPENQAGQGPAHGDSTERRQVAWIGRSVRIEGKVVSDEDLTIDGHVSGAIELGSHSLSIGPSAQITADLLAKSITVSGTVKGNVKALDRLELKATGSIEGVEGATVAGRVQAGRER